MTRQALFNWAVLALLAVLALNTASIARSLRRIERKDRHPTPVWFLMKAPAWSTFGHTPFFDVTALPLWMWTHERTLPTLQACERQAASTRLMRCIASDDPRLKQPMENQ